MSAKYRDAWAHGNVTWRRTIPPSSPVTTIYFIDGPRAGETTSVLGLPPSQLNNRESLDGYYEIDFGDTGKFTYKWVSTPEPEPSEFFVEPIIGYRAWHYSETLGLLTAAHGSTIWHPYEKMTAECKRDQYVMSQPRHDSPAPHYNCTCGIYMHDSCEQVRIQESSYSIMGEVYGWGKVVEAEHGHRVEYAYPKSLRVSAALPNPELIAQRLSETYGVPAEVSTDQPMTVTIVATPRASYTITSSAIPTGFPVSTLVDWILQGHPFSWNPTVIGNTTISWTT